MASSSKTASYVSGFNGALIGSKPKGVPGFFSFSSSSKYSESKSRRLPVLSIDFLGKPLVVPDQKGFRDFAVKAPNKFLPAHAQTGRVSRALTWWEKNLKPNMAKIQSTQQLIDFLQNAGDTLVVVHFYSPGCGGCKVLHPKICQLAELHPDAIFVEVNYEELTTMCQCLNVNVLPFFRFYRGAEGRVCSFSCTNATIKKFKDALAKYGSDRCSPGPAKGLDETELIRLVAAGELKANVPLSFGGEASAEDLLVKNMDLSGFLNNAGNKVELQKRLPHFRI